MNLQKGLVVHWTMDNRDTTGDTTFDNSAYGYNGTEQGAINIVDAPVGNAYRFDGSNEYVSVNEQTIDGETSASLAGWVNTAANQSWAGVFGHATNIDTEAGGIMIRQSDTDDIDVFINGATNGVDVRYSSVDWTEWKHIAATWNGETLTLYVDGVSVGTSKYAGTIDDLGLFQAGRYTWADRTDSHYYLNGDIADVRLYNRCLSAEEVQALANMRSQQQSNTSRPINTTVNGKDVVLQRDSQGSWILVQNYEHYGDTNPSVGPGSTFPQLPNGLRTISDVQNAGSNGELRHVDNITQYGSWQVDAVRLEGVTSNHGRKIHFYSENQDVIDAVVNDSVSVGHSQLKDQVTKYPDHSAFLPDDMSSDNDNETDDRSDRIFGHGFPMYGDGSDGTRVHWAVAGYGSRWEVDDSPSTDYGNTTIHRVWVRTGLFE